jgi:UMP-CMP kinase
LLRAEQKREGSKYGEIINHYIKEGLIVPMEVTIALLEQAMKEAIAEGKEKRFLIDGFPRKMDQAVKFEEVVVPSKLVLFFECPEEVMLKRLLKRGESSGRVDDNIESIKKRFAVFADTSMPVIEAYEKQNKVKKVKRKKKVLFFGKIDFNYFLCRSPVINLLNRYIKMLEIFLMKSLPKRNRFKLDITHKIN